jgi:Ran GTPase-activating protein (RanGAP) involved in mRNA processing and transport
MFMRFLGIGIGHCSQHPIAEAESVSDNVGAENADQDGIDENDNEDEDIESEDEDEEEEEVECDDDDLGYDDL